ncbi:MAG: radical SAM protein [Firmicutes bacterium]|nr:radical SAM protein [Bacillota bacterium]
MIHQVLIFSNTCNNNCIFCSAASNDNVCLSMEEATRIIKDAVSTGIRDIVISGREATTREELLPLVERALKEGIRNISIQTNARKFEDIEFLRKFKKPGVSFFSSIHGLTADVHDELSGVPGSFEQTFQGLKNMLMLGFSVATNSVITKSNFKDIPKLTRLLYEIGVSLVTLAYPLPSGNAPGNYNAISPKYSEIQPYVIESFKVAAQFHRIGNIQGVPFCCLKGFEGYSNEAFYAFREEVFRGGEKQESALAGRKILNTFGPPCNECSYSIFCEGVFKNYTELYGWSDITPVILSHVVEEEGEEMEMNGSLYPIRMMPDKDSGQPVSPVVLIPRPFGGFMIYREKIFPLTEKGFNLISSLNGKVNLREIESKFGSKALGFLVSLSKEEKLIKFIDRIERIVEQPYFSPGRSSFPDGKYEFELPRFGRRMLYPRIKLT